MNRTAVGDAPVLPPHPRAQTSLNTEALDQSNRKCEVGVVDKVNRPGRFRGSIKKDSNKLTQVLDFERQKENEEKTVLLASTYNKTPVPERPAENFTEPVVDFLGRHPVLMMTGLDLYRMVRDVVDNEKDPSNLIELLHDQEGVLVYRS